MDKVSTRRRSGWLVAGGVVAAVSQPLTGLIGLLVAIGCGFGLLTQGRRLSGLAVLALAALVLILHAVFVGALGGSIEGDAQVG